MSEIFLMASGFSIFEMIGILYFENLSIKPFNSSRSFLFLTKERAIQSTFFLIANIASYLSFFVNAGSEILVFGRFTPLLELKLPP